MTLCRPTAALADVRHRSRCPQTGLQETGARKAVRGALRPVDPGRPETCRYQESLSRDPHSIPARPRPQRLHRNPPPPKKKEAPFLLPTECHDIHAGSHPVRRPTRKIDIHDNYRRRRHSPQGAPLAGFGSRAVKAITAALRSTTGNTRAPAWRVTRGPWGPPSATAAAACLNRTPVAPPPHASDCGAAQG